MYLEFTAIPIIYTSIDVTSSGILLGRAVKGIKQLCSQACCSLQQGVNFHLLQLILQCSRVAISLYEEEGDDKDVELLDEKVSSYPESMPRDKI